MSTSAAPAPKQPGDPAPEFTLDAINHDGTVSLADYRGKAPVLLAIFRGLWCPFCRRAIAQLGPVSEKLKAMGVETLAVVATNARNGRTYFRLRPTKVPLAADPEGTMFRAFGLPRVEMTPEVIEAIQQTKVNPTGELSAELPILEAVSALDKVEGFSPTPDDGRDGERQMGQLKGQFLIDRDGVVRWVNVECANEGLGGFGKFPSEEQLLEVTRAVA
jgi:peroxiredoxin